MNRLDLFKSVKVRCEEQYSPSTEAVWKPIVEQLEYLIAFESGEEVDRTLIQNIDIGLRALRNLDDVLPEVAKELYEVQRKAEAMATENGMRNRLAI